MNGTTRALSRLAEIVARLRGPDGCPWDREQTLRDMSGYILEEAAEVRDAVEESDGDATASVREELGDVLMTVFLAAQICEDSGAFGLEAIAEEVGDKLVRRHPHVFGDDRLEDADAVLSRWNEIKSEEKARLRGDDGASDEPVSRLDGIPRSLPPLLRAGKVSSRAAKCGFDWDDAHGPLAKVREEAAEVEALLTRPESAERAEEELGDLLFSVVNLCRKMRCDPDRALRRGVRKFESRFRELERRLGDLESRSPEEMDRVWNELRGAVS